MQSTNPTNKNSDNAPNKIVIEANKNTGSVNFFTGGFWGGETCFVFPKELIFCCNLVINSF